MLDSTGKVGNGVLRGNINQLGDFDVCTNIKTIVKVSASQSVRVRGKYCLAHIETQAAITELKVPIHMVHGRGLFNSHLGNVRIVNVVRQNVKNIIENFNHFSPVILYHVMV